MIEHRAFFGDGEKTFSLTRPMIEELQRKTGVGIGALFARIQTQAFGLQDIAETIRLALIGGGTSPAEADALVKTYVEEQPLALSVDLAHVILALRFFGKPEEKPQDEPRPYFFEIDPDSELAASAQERAADATGNLAAAIRAAYADVDA